MNTYVLSFAASRAVVIAPTMEDVHDLVDAIRQGDDEIRLNVILGLACGALTHSLACDIEHSETLAEAVREQLRGAPA